jgi:chemosensory pili system protein ChpC
VNQPAETLDTLPTRVSCLVLTLADRKLLVPITAVAEVVTTQQQPSGGDGGFCHGWIDWREQRIPLVSFEAACGGAPAPLGAFYRIAVFNAIDDAADLGFYALPVGAIPQSLQVVPQTVLVPEDSADGLLAMEAVVGEHRAWVPRLDRLETRVAALARG